MSSSFAELPLDLAKEIASRVDHLPTLTSLCLTSRSWNFIGTRALYRRHVDLDFHLQEGTRLNDEWSSPCQLERTMVLRPDLAALVTGVRINIISTTPYQRDFHTDLKRVAGVLRNVLEVGTNIVLFGLSSPSTWMDPHLILDLLLPLLNCPQTLTRLQTLEVKLDYSYQAEASPLTRVLRALPSLTTFISTTTYFTLGNDSVRPSPTFALHSLTTSSLSNDCVQLLSQSPTQLSLQSITFEPSCGSVPIWTDFPSLRNVHIRFYNQIDGFGNASDSLATCLFAENVKISAVNLYTLLECQDMLALVPPSTRTLDLSNTKEMVSDYVVEWLRDDAWRQCPGLKRIRFNDARSDSVGGERESLCLVGECEKLCRRRGIDCEWVV